MPKINPFTAVHYNPEKIDDLADVITPPYDNIPEAQVPMYLERSEFNYAHVILPREEKEPYAQATKLLAQWREQQVLVTDSSPAYYLYQQSFEVGSTTFHRNTLMCTVQLSEFKDEQVRPHENTHGSHREDRLRILRKTQFNLSHIFAMVNDEDGYLPGLYSSVTQSAPLLQCTTQDRVEHSIWKIAPESITGLESFFESRPLYILDGHHRYSSAVEYAKENNVLGGKAPASSALFAIASANDPALLVFPTHRKIKSIDLNGFSWEKFETVFDHRPMTEKELGQFTEKPTQSPSFALWINKELHLCTAKDVSHEQQQSGKTLGTYPVLWSDTKFLEEMLGLDPHDRADKIEYEKTWSSVWFKRDEIDLAIFHAPPALETICNIADEKGFMPQKSTFFFPKLAAGLILRPLQ